MLLCSITAHGDSLTTDYTGLSIIGRRIDGVCVIVGLRPHERKRPSLMQGVQTAEIDTTTVHNIERVRVGEEHIERMNIVQFAIGSMNKAWYAAAQVSREY